MRPLKPVPPQFEQPAPRQGVKGSPVQPISRRTSTPTGFGSLQCAQMTRARRCARMILTELATRNGSTHMLSSRLTVDGESFVWRVERTRLSVMVDILTNSAVSQERD